MTKEGNIFMGRSRQVKPATYLLAECKSKIVAGEEYGNDDIEELYVGDSSLQAEFVFWANVRLLLEEGKNLLLVTNPDDEFIFPGV